MPRINRSDRLISYWQMSKKSGRHWSTFHWGCFEQSWERPGPQPLEPDTVNAVVGIVMKASQKYPFFPQVPFASPLWQHFVLLSLSTTSWITMQIILNGEKTGATGPTLYEMIVEKGFTPDTVIAEVNLQLIKKENWRQCDAESIRSRRYLWWP